MVGSGTGLVVFYGDYFHAEKLIVYRYENSLFHRVSYAVPHVIIIYTDKFMQGGSTMSIHKSLHQQVNIIIYGQLRLQERKGRGHRPCP